MRVLLLHNSDAGQLDSSGTEDLLRLIADAGHTVAARPHDDPDIEAAAADASDLIAIAGGDGTSGRLVKRLLQCPVPLTFLPMGTANNIARSLGLADLSLAQLVAGWPHASPRWLDIGVIDGPCGRQHFIEGVGVGLFTRTMLEIDAFDSLAHLGTPQEKLAEALTLLGERLRTYETRRMTMRLDGRDLSGDYLMVEAMNIRFVGPNLHVAPDCDPGDGLLDVVLVSENDRTNLLAHLARWRRGDLLAPTLPTHRGAHLQIEWHGSTLHIDDEAWPPDGEGEYKVPSTIDIRARQHAFRVLLPSSSPTP